jgi:hypothetical protein
MLRRRRTPFSTMTMKMVKRKIVMGKEKELLCETAWISVVCLTGSWETKRPLESTKWEAKRVFIKVDFPRPVWPVRGEIEKRVFFWIGAEKGRHTHEDDVELETSLQELMLDLMSDRVETDIGRRLDFVAGRSGHEVRWERAGCDAIFFSMDCFDWVGVAGGVSRDVGVMSGLRVSMLRRNCRNCAYVLTVLSMHK